MTSVVANVICQAGRAAPRLFAPAAGKTHWISRGIDRRPITKTARQFNQRFGYEDSNGIEIRYELQTEGSAEILAPALQYSIDFDKYSSPTPLFSHLMPTAYQTLTPYECIAVGYTLRMGSHLFSDLILDGHRISPNVEVCLGYIQNEALNGDVVLNGITHFK